MKYNKKKGFTIVELVIVIAVIGILSAILIPTFVGVTQAAQEAALRSNVANAYSMYAADAADGKKGETETKLVFLPQTKVMVAEGNDGTKAYAYVEDKGWVVTGTTVNLTLGDGADQYKILNSDSYNGFYVFAKNSDIA